MVEKEEEVNENILNLVTLLAIIILMIYTVAAPIFEKIHFHYMHESGLCMIIGVVITLIAIFFNPETNFTNYLNFSGEIFFTFVLPPIIFSAGYNLHRTSFFKYFIYILSFGVLGTIMSFLWVAPFTLLFNSFDNFYLPVSHKEENTNEDNEISDVVLNATSAVLKTFLENSTFLNSTNNTNPNKEESKVQIIHFTVPEVLLFASVISATDTIAALTFIHEDSEPKLFAILFGEGVINDAVCIVLYRILSEFTKSGKPFTSGTPIMMFNKFLSLTFFSFLVGMLCGCLCAYLFKYFLIKGIKLNRAQEIAMLLFFSFMSYTFAEEMGLSPIVTLLFCGIFMSNYAFYNLSFQAREESSVVSRMISNIAEAFVFTYLGLTLIGYIQQSLCLSFIIIELFVVVCGRIFAIFGLSYIFKLCGFKNFKMKNSQKGIMSCAGSIRGAIAFGLAISIETSNELHKEIIVSSTLILVFFSTIVFGALMPFMINVMKKLDPPEDNLNNVPLIEEDKEIHHCDHFNFLHPNFSDKYEGSKEKNLEILKSRVSYWLGHYWVEFDDMIIKPALCYQWPWTFVDNKNVKKIILDNLLKYEEEEKHKKHFIRGEHLGEKSNENSEVVHQDSQNEKLLETITFADNQESLFLHNEEDDEKEKQKKKLIELEDMDKKK